MNIEHAWLRLQCSELAEKLAEDVESEGLKGRTVTLKLKTTTFEVRTRAATLARHISGYDDIFREALKLLRPELPIIIRLMVRLRTASLRYCATGSQTSQGSIECVPLIYY